MFMLETKQTAPVKGDEYKVKQLQKMLEEEEKDPEKAFGARLSHPIAGSTHLTIDAGGLRALIAYYQTHTTDLTGSASLR